MPIYVHAKILIVDDRLLRIGSANINNHSMGFDSEGDLVVEASIPASGYKEKAQAIVSVRDMLVAEASNVPTTPFLGTGEG